MPSKVTIAKGGTHFLLTCAHCANERKELVNPDVNPNPFAYQAQCAGCGETLNPDMVFICEVQASFSRAMLIAKKATQSTEAMGGVREGDVTTGSPAYSASDNVIPAETEFMKKPLQSQINQGANLNASNRPL